MPERGINTGMVWIQRHLSRSEMPMMSLTEYADRPGLANAATIQRFWRKNGQRGGCVAPRNLGGVDIIVRARQRADESETFDSDIRDRQRDNSVFNIPCHSRG